MLNNKYSNKSGRRSDTKAVSTRWSVKRGSRKEMPATSSVSISVLQSHFQPVKHSVIRPCSPFLAVGTATWLLALGNATLLLQLKQKILINHKETRGIFRLEVRHCLRRCCYLLLCIHSYRWYRVGHTNKQTKLCRKLKKKNRCPKRKVVIQCSLKLFYVQWVLFQLHSWCVSAENHVEMCNQLPISKGHYSFMARWIWVGSWLQEVSESDFKRS